MKLEMIISYNRRLFQTKMMTFTALKLIITKGDDKSNMSTSNLILS